MRDPPKEPNTGVQGNSNQEQQGPRLWFVCPWVRSCAGTKAGLLKLLLCLGKMETLGCHPVAHRPEYHILDQTPKGRTHWHHVVCTGGRNLPDDSLTLSWPQQQDLQVLIHSGKWLRGKGNFLETHPVGARVLSRAASLPSQ